MNKAGAELLTNSNLWQDYNVAVDVKPTIKIEKNKEELEQKLNDIVQSIKACDSQKIRLLNLYEETLSEITQYQSQFPKSKESMNVKNECEMSAEMYDENIIKITLNNNVAVMPKIIGRKHYQDLRDYYIPAMNKAIDKLNPDIKFERAFILFVQTFTTPHIRDLDNTFKSFVFDSLRYSKIITDDCYKNLRYFDKGQQSKGEPRTEIYVTSLNYMFELLIHKG